MDIKKVSVQIARPRGSYEGRVEYGCYVVSGDAVILTDENGVPVDKYKLSRKLEPGEDAKAVACGLTRQLYSNQTGGAFNRKLVYPTSKF